MSSLHDRENKRQNSIVSSIAGLSEEKTNNTTSKNKDRIQKAYFIDKDLFKALKMKSINEEINLTEAVNKALRDGLKDYL